jgi:hypothetical protein
MRTIAVYPGRFHPFHKGHAASFQQLASVFGSENTYLALSAKQEPPKSPFSAGDRAKMAMALGIPKENIISVANTYGGDEYAQRFSAAGMDPNEIVLVLGVSGKDMGTDPRFSFAPKRDGSASYLQAYDPKNLQPMTKHAYIMTTDVAEFPIAGQAMTDASQIRAAYINGDEQLRNQILADLYGNAAKHIKPIFDAALLSPAMTKPAAPKPKKSAIKQLQDNPLKEGLLQLIKQTRPLLKEANPKQKLKLLKLIKESTTQLPVTAEIHTPPDYLDE